MRIEILNAFYAQTVEALRGYPRDGELEAWQQVLGDFSESDLDAALRRWKADTSIEEFSQRPRGSRMPSAAELKWSIEVFNNSNTKQFIPCGKCEEGWVRVFKGRSAGGNQLDPKLGGMKRCECFNRWKAQRVA